jgi:hypothetical protein
MSGKVYGSLLGVLVVFIGIVLAVSFANRDTTPPQLYVEVPEQVAAGVPFTLDISADKPVTYTVRYGELELSEVAQMYELSLIAKAGEQPLEITAVDAANNQTSLSFVVYGVPKLEARLQAAEQLIPGEPLSVVIAWPASSPPPTYIELLLNGEALHLFKGEQQAVALAGVPLGAEPAKLPLTARLSDGYGRTLTLEHTIEVLPYPQEVQELRIPANVLSVVTPEGRRLEADALEAAYAHMWETPTPKWQEPFLLPVEGRNTSGFGAPRRYAPGGNVSFHYGTDIAAPTGTPIAATNRGRVLIADFYPIKGGFTVIDHGASVYSFYFHQSRILVSVGDVVARGQIIGEVGSTGLSTGPHLHWEMRVNTIATNPMSWVDRMFP